LLLLLLVSPSSSSDVEELTYVTYEEVTQALFSAHELEVIIFGDYCTWNVEEAQSASIVSPRGC
jgi:hypothetical protein